MSQILLSVCVDVNVSVWLLLPLQYPAGSTRGGGGPSDYFSTTHTHTHTYTLIESVILPMKISRLSSVMAKVTSRTTSSTSITVSLSVRELS